MAREDEFLDAAKRGDGPAVADFLRTQPELVCVADAYHKTALHWAAEKNHAHIARLLLDAGADIEATTSWGATPLEWAATMGNSSVADLLLARGAGRFTLISSGKFSERSQNPKLGCACFDISFQSSSIVAGARLKSSLSPC